MKKILLLASMLLMGAVAQARGVSVTCDFIEGRDTEALRSTQVRYQAEGGSHKLSPFDIEYAKGFVAMSHEQLVVNIKLKENAQVISFHGPIKAGSVGGGIRIPGTNTWLRVSCQGAL